MSRLDYCNALIHELPDTMISKLQRVQNKAARIVTRTTRHTHITPVLKKLHCLPVKYRGQYTLLIHTYKSSHDQSPVYFKDMLQVYTPGRTFRSQNAQVLVVPKMRTLSNGNICFNYAAPSLWNTLPADIREIKTMETLKQV